MKITLKSATFTGAVQNVTSTGRVGWSGENHRTVVDAVTAGFEGDNGMPLKLEEHVKNVIRLACCPTPEMKLQVIKDTLETAGYQLDKTAENALALISDIGSFSNFLANNDNPATGKRFITKERKSKKRDAFKALLGGGDSDKNTKATPAPEATGLPVTGDSVAEPASTATVAAGA